MAKAATISVANISPGKVISLNEKEFVKIDSDPIKGSQFQALQIFYVQKFGYTGGAQTWTAPHEGTYKIELWGAQGGADDNGGKGGYVSGNIRLTKGQVLYVYVGQRPTYSRGLCYTSNPNTAFNGTILGSCTGGGGATDIRLTAGTWSTSSSLRSRIMVAGGGGAHYGSYEGSGGYGGGLIGGTGTGHAASGTYTLGAGGSQTGSSFGIGVSDVNTTTTGGGGYYGGGKGYAGNAGGGSAYISGHTGSVAITSATDQTPKAGCTTGTSNNTCSIHYSGKVFTNTIMIDGAGYSWTNVKGIQIAMPNPVGGNYPLGQGHSGNGAARITLI